VIVINMPTPKGEAAQRTPVNHYLFQMISATLGKVIPFIFFCIFAFGNPFPSPSLRI
jgi:hypothetical protein